MSSTDLAQRLANRPTEQIDLRTQIMDTTAQFQLALPRGFEATQLVRDALTCLRKTPELARCDSQSVLGGLMSAAQLGLRPAVLGQCWLLPLWNRKAGHHQAQLIVGYQGYVELAYRSNRIGAMDAHIVYANDEFDVEYGDRPRLKHRPALREHGDAFGYYATARLIPKASKFEFMTREECEDHRDKFAMAKRKDGTIIGPWRDHFDQMALKTTVLKLAKLMPKSPELIMALSVDGGVRVDPTPKADPADVTEIVDGEILEEPTPALSQAAVESALGVDVWARAEEQAKQVAAEAGYGEDEAV
jgi:recombination protein RecT